MQVCAGLSGSLVLSLTLALVFEVPSLWAWEADLELLDLVEEIPQTFYQFLNVEQVSPFPWQPEVRFCQGFCCQLLDNPWKSSRFKSPQNTTCRTEHAEPTSQCRTYRPNTNKTSLRFLL
ncbi:hypothetical protein AMECASPLE_032045 [Ameca splendens]|uniref:Uncharacterized protein n=1 Tax=Ameca splendens TaxID=208324 RepID=A0ABV0XJH9_9TELE